MVAALNEFTNELMKHKDRPIAQTNEWREAVETLVLLMAPSTPYVTEELWQRLGKPYSVHLQSWPKYDELLAKQEIAEIVVQVNGKVRERLMVPVDMSESDAIALALEQPKVIEQLSGRAPDRVIYVPGRLLNLVVRG
jgi:leucyl-tRNA synthetase